MDTANTPRPAAAKKMMKYKKARCYSEVLRETAGRLNKPEEDAETAAAAKAACQALAAKGMFIEQWSLDDCGCDLAWCGRSGSPTKVHRIQSVVLTASGYKEIAATDDGVRGLVAELIEDHTIG